jgi:hypothetical protein
MRFRPTQPLNQAQYPVPVWDVRQAIKDKVNEDDLRLRKYKDGELRPDVSKHPMQITEAFKRAFAWDIYKYLP